MRILHITTDFRPSIGGIATYIEQVSLASIKIGMDTYILHVVENSDTRKIDEEGNVIRFHIPDDLSDFRKLKYMKSIRSIVESIDPSVVQVHTFNSLEYMLYGWKYPWIWTAHFSYLARFVVSKRPKDVLLRFILGRILKGADAIVCVSKDVARKVESFVKHPNLHVVPNGVNLEMFKPLSPKDKLGMRKSLNIDESAFVLFFPSKWVFNKGVHVLAEAILRIASDYKDTYEKLFLILVGKGSGDSYERHVEELLASFGRKLVLENIPYEDMPKFYGISDAVVVPSFYETFGMVVLEAYACGIPVIASNVGGLSEIVVHGRTGYLFEPGNASELAYAIHILVKDRENYLNMCRNALDFVKDFSWEKVVFKLRSIYEGIARK